MTEQQKITPPGVDGARPPDYPGIGRWRIENSKGGDCANFIRGAPHKALQVTIGKPDSEEYTDEQHYRRLWHIVNFLKARRTQNLAEFNAMSNDQARALLMQQTDTTLHLAGKALQNFSNGYYWRNQLSFEAVRTAAIALFGTPPNLPAPQTRILAVLRSSVQQLLDLFTLWNAPIIAAQENALLNFGGSNEAFNAVAVDTLGPALGSNTTPLNISEETGATIPAGYNQERDCVFVLNESTANLSAFYETASRISIRSMMLYVMMKTMIRDHVIWNKTKVAKLLRDILGDNGKLWTVVLPNNFSRGGRATMSEILGSQITRQSDTSDGKIYKMYNSLRRQR